MNKKFIIILASTSKRRIDLFNLLFEDFYNIGADINEMLFDSKPIKTVIENSSRKVLEVYEKLEKFKFNIEKFNNSQFTLFNNDQEKLLIKYFRGAKEQKLMNNQVFLNNLIENIKINNFVIIGVDTIVYFNKKIFGKPENIKKAFDMLVKLNGNEHKVYSGVSIFYKNKFIYKFFEKSWVKFLKFDKLVIERYIETNEWMDAAGGYKIQGKGVFLVEKIKGSLSNIMGFPVEKFLKYYNKFLNKIL